MVYSVGLLNQSVFTKTPRVRIVHLEFTSINYLCFAFITFLKILIIVVPFNFCIIFTLAERKILGAIQRRQGPNVVGVFGILQPLSDGFKLLVKKLCTE